MTAEARAAMELGLGEVVAARAAGGSRNLSLVVTTDKGEWLLRRRYEGYSEPARVAFDHGAAGYLAAGGAPVVAPVGEEGQTWWEGPDGVWEAYPLVTGRPLVEASAEVEALGEALATFHRAGSGFTGRCDKGGPRGETGPGELRRVLAGVAAGPGADDVVEPYRRLLERAAAALSDETWAALPHTLVHGDVQPANVLMAEGRVAAFVDLDWVAWRPRVYDLAFALLTCCARHETPIGEGEVWALTQPAEVDLGAAGRFLAAYQAGGGELAAEERAALGPQVALSGCHIRVGNALKVGVGERAAFVGRRGVRVRGKGAAWVEEAVGWADGLQI